VKRKSKPAGFQLQITIHDSRITLLELSPAVPAQVKLETSMLVASR
jgi:hypothetical protein